VGRTAFDCAETAALIKKAVKLGGLMNRGLFRPTHVLLEDKNMRDRSALKARRTVWEFTIQWQDRLVALGKSTQKWQVPFRLSQVPEHQALLSEFHGMAT
jgi:hypothetical protein